MEGGTNHVYKGRDDEGKTRESNEPLEKPFYKQSNKENCKSYNKEKKK